MITTVLRTAALASLILASAAPAFAVAAAPRPATAPSLGNKPLHSEFVVEANHKGQVVRIMSGKSSHSPLFDVITYGNVIQMWIGKTDGTREAGLFRILWDYNPKTGKISRKELLISAGGPWANADGAANKMIKAAQKRSAQSRAALNKILGITPAPAPTP